MAMKKVGVTNMKLKVGAEVTGYLLSSDIKHLNGEDGPFDLCKAVIQDAKLGPVAIWLQGDYGHVLKKGYKTRIAKVKTTVDGEEKNETIVEQDETDKITVG